ncbi:MAG: methyltransferase domain-containing protein [Bryobacteraceae bacterium]|nr:methyltransferase domain-containing protein [Bryobacteraceae bacterium]
MTVTFTGERVIPGEVDVDLWNEHISRYEFVSRIAAGRRVLDAGCGAGYGSALLAQSGAASVVGLDIAPEALSLARQSNSVVPRLAWICGSCPGLPFPPNSFDLVVAFEVIEHLEEWPRFLDEVVRVLRKDGLFVVSTPNKSFYTESRRDIGSNPFHYHEFELEEFQEELSQRFPQVQLYFQDHTEGIAFLSENGRTPEVKLRKVLTDPGHSAFFLAVCGQAPDAVCADLIYLPSAANAVREKLVHIDRLRGELQVKDQWLQDAHAAHAELLQQHRAQTAELQASNGWAETLNARLQTAGARVQEVQSELADQQLTAREAISRLEMELDERNRSAIDAQERLMAELLERSAHMRTLDLLVEERNSQLQQRTAELDEQTTQLRERSEDLQGRIAELASCVEILHKTEAELEVRTRWAQSLDANCLLLEERQQQLEAQLRDAQAKLGAVQSSRWVKIGRAVGLGPELAKA